MGRQRPLEGESLECPSGQEKCMCGCVGGYQGYNLDASKIEASAFYSNSNATAEDIAVVKVNDEAYADTVKKAFEDRIAEQKKSFQDYNAAEVPKLEDAVVKVSGKYVVLVVSGDSAKAKEIVEGYVK